MADKYFITADPDNPELQMVYVRSDEGWIPTGMRELPEGVSLSGESNDSRSNAMDRKEQYQRMRAQGIDEGQRLRQLDAASLNTPEALAVGSVESFRRLGKGLGDIRDFIADTLGDPTALDRQNRRDAEYDARKELMRPYYEENPGAAIVSEIPTFMATGAVINPAMRYGVSAGMRGVARGAEAASQSGRGALASAVERTRGNPGIAGRIAERVYGESVVPRQMAARSSAQRVAQRDPVREGMLEDVLTHTGTGAVEGLIDPEMNPVEGALASIVGSTAGQYIKPKFHASPDYWRPKERELIEWYKSQGGRLLPGMETGNRQLQKFEGNLRQQDRFTDYMNFVEESNKELSNKLAWRAAGIPFEQADKIDGKVLREHMANLKKEYNDIQSKSRGKFEPEELNQLGRVIGDLKKNTSKPSQKAADAVAGYLDEIRKTTSRQVDRRGRPSGFVYDGAKFQDLRSRLKADINDAYNGNKNTQAQALQKVLEVVDRSMERGINGLATRMDQPDLLKRWKDLNERYAMTKLLLNNGTDIATGDFDHRKFMSFLDSKDSERAILTEVPGGISDPDNRISDLINLSKVRTLMDRQEKPGLAESSIGLPSKPSPTRQSFLQNMMTLTPMVGAIPGLDRLALGLYSSPRFSPAVKGYGMGFMTGDTPYRDIPQYIRAASQSSQMYPTIAEGAGAAVGAAESLMNSIFSGDEQ